jgi:hypothetical protein
MVAAHTAHSKSLFGNEQVVPIAVAPECNDWLVFEQEKYVGSETGLLELADFHLHGKRFDKS